MVSQPLQKAATLSTADNTFHFYGICLNRNRKIYLKYQNGIQIRFPNGRAVKTTSGMILDFLKRQFVPLGSAIVKSFDFCFLKLYLTTLKFTSIMKILIFLFWQIKFNAKSETFG